MSFYSADPIVQSYEPRARQARAEVVGGLLRRLDRAIARRPLGAPARPRAVCHD